MLLGAGGGLLAGGLIGDAMADDGGDGGGGGGGGWGGDDGEKLVLLYLGLLFAISGVPNWAWQWLHVSEQCQLHGGKLKQHASPSRLLDVAEGWVHHPKTRSQTPPQGPPVQECSGLPLTSLPGTAGPVTLHAPNWFSASHHAGHL